MPENLPKILRAEKVTGKVVEGFIEAQRALQTCWINGYGVLTESRSAWSDLCQAKAAIDKALTAMRDFSDWPRDEDYD